jgi:hypothetical protein
MVTTASYMASDTKPKYSGDAGTGVVFSVKIVRAAIAFHSVITAGSDATSGLASLGVETTADPARHTVATSAVPRSLRGFARP